jgi:hypothetical protein
MWFDIESIDLTTSCRQHEAKYSDSHAISFHVRHQHLITPVQISCGKWLHELEGILEVRRCEAPPSAIDAADSSIVGQLSYNRGHGTQEPSYDAWLEISDLVFDRLWQSEAGGLRCIGVELSVQSLVYNREKRVELWDIDAHKHINIESCTYHFERRRKKKM